MNVAAIHVIMAVHAQIWHMDMSVNVKVGLLDQCVKQVLKTAACKSQLYLVPLYL